MSTPTLLTRFLVLGLALSAGGQCRQADSLDTDAILRINSRMITLFQNGDYDGLAAFFSDSARLEMPGGYRIDGREMIRAHFGRYGLPMSWTFRHYRFAHRPEEGNGLPPVLIGIGEAEDSVHPESRPYVWQTARWSFVHEAEDGVIRHDSHPVLLKWVDDPQHGWMVTWMGRI